MNFKFATFLLAIYLLLSTSVFSQCDPSVSTLPYRYVRDTTYVTFVTDTSMGTAGNTYTWTFAGGVTATGPVATHFTTTTGGSIPYTISITGPGGCTGAATDSVVNIPVLICNFQAIWETSYGAMYAGAPFQGGYSPEITMALTLVHPDPDFTIAALSYYSVYPASLFHTEGIFHWGNGRTTSRIETDYIDFFLSGTYGTAFQPGYLYGGEYNLSAGLTYGIDTLLCPVFPLPQISGRFPGAIATPLITGNTTYCAGDTLRLVASDTTIQFHNMLHVTDTAGSAGRFYYSYPVYGTGVGRSTYSFEWLDHDMNVVSTDTTLILNNLSITDSGTYIFHIHENMDNGNDSFYYVHISVLSMPDAGNITGPTSVCVGSSVTLSNTATGGIWYSSLGATVSSGVVTGVTPGTSYIVYSHTNSCGMANDTLAITINALPHAGTISGTGTLCVGTTFTISADSVGGVWSVANPNASVTAGLITGVAAGADTIIYTITNGCGSDMAILPIIIEAMPDAGTITAPSSVCVSGTLSLTAGDPGGTWSVTNGTVSISVTGFVTALSPGTDTIIYIITNGCGADTATDVITIASLPVAGTIFGIDTVCEGASAILTTSGTSGTWSSSNSAIISVSASGTINALAPGTATITYVVTNLCGTASATRTVHVLSVAECAAVGIEEDVTKGNIAIFPNPNSGSFVIKLPEPSPAAIIITDISGKSVSETILTNNEMDIPVSLSGLPAGTYFVKVAAGGKIYHDKVVIW